MSTLAQGGDPEGIRLLREKIKADGVKPGNFQQLVILLEHGAKEDEAMANHLLPAAHDILCHGDGWEYRILALTRVKRMEGYQWLIEALRDTADTGGRRSHSSGMVAVRRSLVIADEFLSGADVPESLKVQDIYEVSYEGQGVAMKQLERWAEDRILEIKKARN
jgi:hypothetical protein